ncbi:M28 family peptidase [Salinibacterium hongtaonis]|uniref:Peptidase M28 n=1 Tax=Homoserinimonas hongtaonis TaxID=2079791 RepID=A0A2U1T2G7_9MICO|nr:M28 family peptidase [Salinibacterium hongtaonis]PWB98074.1 peptidase M28 [Salinibacterium hongtaonis]
MSIDALRPSRARRWGAPVAIAALVAVAIGCTLAQAPAAPLGEDAAAGDFSATRAMEHIEAISQETRPIGSPAHAEARDYLVGELEALGLEVEVQERTGVSETRPGRTQGIAFVQNIVAMREGSDPTGTLVLAAHYDSVNGSLGAGDDGIGIGSIMESARALGDETPTNDLIILFTDGEESGLLGAEAFTRDDSASLVQPVVVVNLEARGTAGSPLTFRTSSPNGPITAYTSAAGGVVANSAMETVFGLMSNDTDFSRFSEGGLLGTDSAIVGGGALYHSPVDSPENLSRASLQQMGQSTLALTRELQDADLAALQEGQDTIVATVPWGLLRFPLALELPFAIAGLGAAIAAAVIGRRRRELTVPRTLIGIVVALVSVALAAGGAYALWAAALAIDPGQASASVGEPYVAWPYLAAIAVLTVGAVVGPFLLLRRMLGQAALVTGALVAVTVVGVALAVALPGAASVVAFPALFAAVAMVVAQLLPARFASWRVAVLALGALPAFALIVPVAVSASELGLPLGGPVAALFVAIVLLMTLPVVAEIRPATSQTGERARPLRAAVGAASVVVVVAALAAGGLVANAEGATLPRQESVEYAIDTDAGTALWSSRRAPVSEWSAELLDGDRRVLADVAPWWGTSARSTGEAPVAELEAPSVTVVTDEAAGDRRTLTLQIDSRRSAPTLGVWVGGSTVLSAKVGGVELAPEAVGETWTFGLHIEGVGAEGVEIELLIEGTGPVAVLVADRTADLGVIDEFAGPEGRVLFQQGVWVSRQTAL